MKAGHLQVPGWVPGITVTPDGSHLGMSRKEVDRSLHRIHEIQRGRRIRLAQIESVRREIGFELPALADRCHLFLRPRLVMSRRTRSESRRVQGVIGPAKPFSTSPSNHLSRC